MFGDNNGLKSPAVSLTIHVALNKEGIFLNLSLIIFKIDTIFFFLIRDTVLLLNLWWNQKVIVTLLGISKDRLDNMSLN